MLRPIGLAVATLICVTVWLVLIVVTDFSAWSVGVGLLGGLLVTGESH